MVVWQCWMNDFQRRYENIVIQKQLMVNKLHFSMNDWWVVSQLVYWKFSNKKIVVNIGIPGEDWSTEPNTVQMYFREDISSAQSWKYNLDVLEEMFRIKRRLKNGQTKCNEYGFNDMNQEYLEELKLITWYLTRWVKQCTMKNLVGEVRKMAENDE